MNKFKFEPPQQHRRSLQQPKNQHVALMATLDKCTQILREDRLFIRNQIKNCNQEVLEIFKLFPRQSQLQHLQTRLRKYVQHIKNRLKNEQLARFKETLTSQISFPEPKRAINPPKPSQSTLKHPLKPTTSAELVRSSGRMNRSQQHAPNHLNMNSSLRHFQDLLRQKLSQDVIEERESQNVTSARQGRQENEASRQPEYQRTKPLQEQFFDSVQNKFAGRSAALHNNYIPTKNLGDSLTFLNDFNKEKNKSTQQLPTMKPGPWQFEKKAKQALYQYQHTQDDPQQLNLNFCERSRQKQSLPSEQRDDSIFDRHFYGTSEKSVTPLSQQHNEYYSHISQEIKNPISLSMKEGTYSNLSHLSSSNLYEQKEAVTSKWTEPSIVNFKLKESNFKQTEEAVANRSSISRIEDTRKSEENLFTPQELLNQCRNFLKYRGDSNHKSNTQSNVHSNLTESINNHTEQTVLDLAKPKVEIPPKEQISTKKQEDSGYIFPQIKDSSKKSQSQKEENFNYTHFQTFANSQDNKTAFSSLQAPIHPPLPVIPVQHTFHGLIQQKIPQNFSIQDFLESLMEAAEMNPFISVRALSSILNNHDHWEALKQIFKKQLSMGKDEELCLPDLAQAINERYNQQHGSNYPHDDRAINGVYDLLDIDQKGYVSREDVSAFLSQIEDAEVDNLQEVSQELWRLFEGADFSNKHKLSYWHFYLVKSSEQFERVSQLLGEFQFEIERNQ